MSLCFPLNDVTIQLLLIHISGHKDSKSKQTVALCPRGGALLCSGRHPLSFPNGCGRAEACHSSPMLRLLPAGCCTARWELGPRCPTHWRGRTRPQAAEGAHGRPAGDPDRAASEEMSSLSHQEACVLPPSLVPFSCIKGSPPQHYGHLGPHASLSGAVLCPVMSSSTPGLCPLNADGTPPPDVTTKIVSRHQQVSQGEGGGRITPSRTLAPHPHPLECSQHPESRGCVSGCRARHAGCAP